MVLISKYWEFVKLDTNKRRVDMITAAQSYFKKQFPDLTQDDYIQKFQRKRSAMAQSFITALHLFHCQGQSMNQIANNYFRQS